MLGLANRSPSGLPTMSRSRRGVLDVPDGELDVTQGDQRLRWVGSLVGLGVALSSATQLRLLPAVGLGEISLLGAAGLLIVDRGWRLERERSTPVSRFFTLYILIGILASIPALLFGYQSDGFLRDFVALAFDALIVAAITFHSRRQVLISQAIRAYVWCFTVPNLVLLAFSFATGSVAGIQLYDGIAGVYTRFLGWSQNANQLATGAAAALIFGLALLRKRRSVVHAALVASAVAIGYYTRSDGLTLALLIGGVLGLRSARRLPRTSSTRTVLDVVTLAIAGLALLRVGDLIRYADGVRNSGGQGSDRMVLWANCVRRIAQSPLVGQGFGPHSWNAAYKVTSMQECHNSVLDVATIAGLPMGAFFVWMFWSCWQRRTVKGSEIGLVVMFVVVLFSNMTRHPALWLVLMWIVGGTQPLAIQGRALTNQFVDSLRPGARKRTSVS